MLNEVSPWARPDAPSGGTAAYADPVVAHPAGLVVAGLGLLPVVVVVLGPSGSMIDMANSHDLNITPGGSTNDVSVISLIRERYEVNTRQEFAAFVARFEAAAPPMDPALVAGASSWVAVIERTADAATHGFLVYATYKDWPWAQFDDVTGLDHRRGAMYLMGNHTIAETMYRHHPGVMLHAPLRLMIFKNDDGDAVFSIDRPSDQFASYGDARIAETGRRLDRLLAGLLTELEVPVPEGLN